MVTGAGFCTMSEVNPCTSLIQIDSTEVTIPSHQTARIPQLKSRRLYHDLREVLLLLQPLESRLGIFQAEGDVIQRRPHLLLLQEAHHIVEHAPRSKIDAPEDAELPQSTHHVWDLLSDSRAPNHSGNRDQAVEPHGAQRLGHRRGADDVDNVINAVPLRREASGDSPPVRMLPVVYDVLGTKREQPVCLCVGARYGDNIGTCCYCDLESVSTSKSSEP